MFCTSLFKQVHQLCSENEPNDGWDTLLKFIIHEADHNSDVFVRKLLAIKHAVTPSILFSDNCTISKMCV